MVCVGHGYPWGWHKPSHRDAQEFAKLQPLRLRGVKYFAHSHTAFTVPTEVGRGPFGWVRAGPLET